MADFGNPEERDAFYEELISTFEEVPGHWHIGNKFPRVTEEEFQQSLESIKQVLLRFGKCGFESNDDFHAVEDFWGDRTHRVEVSSASTFNDECIGELQVLLAETFSLWRVLLVFVDGTRNSLWIHPDSICEGGKYK